jgi:hypothetical protein
MKFKLSTSKYSYYNLQQIKELEELGFKFKEEKDRWSDGQVHYIQGDIEVSIEDLADLQKFISKWGQIVMSEDSIEIYNDYRE